MASATSAATTAAAKKKSTFVDEDIGDLAEYGSGDEEDVVDDKKIGDKAKEQAGHVAVHASSFRDFLLKPALLRAVVDCGFEHPSAVQHDALPQAALGVDVICQAVSGMGKTAVFVLASLQQLDDSPAPASVLVLCHTRELAYQICHEYDRLKKYLPEVKTGVFYGGVPVATNKEIIKSNEPNIIIGTPGRILQLAQEKILDLKNIKQFVLDECDKMLDSLTMRQDVQKIFKLTPRDKQVMMFSATLAPNLREVAKKFMHNPLEIYVNDNESKLTLHGLQQYYVPLQEKEKLRKLVDLLDALDFNQLIIFVKSVQRAQSLNKVLLESNFPSTTLNTQMKQEERIEQYKKFKEYKSRIMVSTNIIGRGVDIERVNVVINYDMPEGNDAVDTYLHRVGRAGRFGTKGLAISFVSTEPDKKVLDGVQKKFVVQIPDLPDEIDSSTYMGA